MKLPPLPAGFIEETTTEALPAVPEGFIEEEAGPEPQYGPLMFEQPQEAPTMEEDSFRAWYQPGSADRPGSLRAIGKSPSTQIVSQSQPIQAELPPVPPGFVEEAPAGQPAVATVQGIQQPGIAAPTPAYRPIIDTVKELPKAYLELGKTIASKASDAYKGSAIESFLTGLASNPDNPYADRAQMMLKTLFSVPVTAGRAIGQLLDKGSDAVDYGTFKGRLAASVTPLLAFKAVKEGLGLVGADGVFDGAWDEQTGIEKTAAQHGERILQENFEAGGVPLAVIGEISKNLAVTGESIAMPIGLLGIGGKAQAVGKPILNLLDMAKHSIPEAAKFAAYTFATTEGTPEERGKAAAHSAAFLMSPVASAGIPLAWASKALAMAINIGYNSPAYVEAVAQADDLAEKHGGSRAQWLASTVTPLLLADILFGAYGKNMKQMRAEYAAQISKDPAGRAYVERKVQENVEAKEMTVEEAKEIAASINQPEAAVKSDIMPPPSEEGQAPSVAPSAERATNIAERPESVKPEPIINEGATISEKPAAVEAVPNKELKKYGENTDSRLDIEKAWSNGNRIFAFNEQDETYSPVTSLDMLRNYSPDSLTILPRQYDPAPMEDFAAKPEPTAPAAEVPAPVAAPRKASERLAELRSQGMSSREAQRALLKEQDQYAREGKPWPPPEGVLSEEGKANFEVTLAKNSVQNRIDDETAIVANAEKALKKELAKKGLPNADKLVRLETAIRVAKKRLVKLNEEMVKAEAAPEVKAEAPKTKPGKAKQPDLVKDNNFKLVGESEKELAARDNAKTDAEKKAAKAEMEAKQGKLFSEKKAEEAPAQEKSPVRAKLEELTSKLKGAKVVIIDKQSELPEGVKPSEGGKVEGVYIGKDKTSYLVVENIEPGQEARVVAHEAVIHGGLRTIMNKAELENMLKNTYLNGPEHEVKIAEKMSERGIDRIEAIEEVIADIWSQREAKPTVWRRLVSEVRSQLRKVFKGMEWSEADVENLIAAAAKRVTEGGEAKGETSTRFSTKKEKLVEDEGEGKGEVDESKLAGIKNRVMRDELMKAGMEDVPQPERKEWQREVDEAVSKMNENPYLQDQLITDLIDGKRQTIEAWEHAVLDAKAVELKRSFNDARDVFDKASGETMRISGERIAVIEDQLMRLALAAKKAGTATARSLAFRRAMFNDDFTLTNLIVRKRAANGGRALTGDQKTDLENMVKLNDKLTKEISELKGSRKGAISKERESYITKLVSELLEGQTISVDADTRKYAKAESVLALEELRAMGIAGEGPVIRKSEKGGIKGLTDKQIELVTKVGAELLIGRKISIEQWKVKMRVALGPRIEGQLDAILVRSLESVKAIKGRVREAKKRKEPVAAPVEPGKVEPVKAPKPPKAPALTPEEKKAAQLDKKIEEMERKIAEVRAGTYKPPVRKTPLPVDREIQAKIDQLAKLREKFNEDLKRDKRNGDDWIKSMDEYLSQKRAKLPDDVRAQVEAELRAASKIEDPAARDKAVAEAINKVNAYVPIKAGEWYEAYIYTNMLSSPLSQERNIFGNSLNALITRPASLVAQGKAREAWEYEKKAFQAILSGAAMKAAKTAFRSGEEGKMMETLSRISENAPEMDKQVQAFEMAKRVKGPESRTGKFFWKKLTLVGRFMHAADTYFGTMIEAGETARLVKEGVAPEQAAERAKALANKYLYRDRINKVPDSSLDIASKTLEFLGSKLEDLRDMPGIEDKGLKRVGKVVKVLMVPFLRTPVKLAQFNIETTPLGFIGANKNRIARAMYKGESFDKMVKDLEAEVAKENPDMSEVNRIEGQLAEIESVSGERYGKAMIGNVLMALGFAAAVSGNTTWAPPEDPEAKKLYYDAGYKPYSFRVPGTDYWLPMLYLGPGALSFMIPAAFKDTWLENPDTVTEDAWKKMFKTAVSLPMMMLDQLPLESMSGIYQAASGREDWNIQRIIGSAIKQNVPASGLLNWIKNLTDPVFRKEPTVSGTVKAAIPGLSESVKALKDSDGLDAEMSLFDALAPYKVGVADDNKERQYQNRMELLRLKAKIKRERAKAMGE